MVTTRNNNKSTPTDKCIPTSASSYPTTLVDALKSILTDEKISDIYLKGNDGIKVPASKCILAAWSPVFRGMLYGKFAEASANVIDIDYPSTTIRKLVEFCYTEKVESIDKLAEMERGKPRKEIEVRHIDEIISLFNIANYYQIKKIKDNLKLFLVEKIFRYNNKWASCYILEEAEANEELQKVSLDYIREYPDLFFEYNGFGEKSLRCLSAESLSIILQDDNIRAPELFLFQCLQRWADLEEYSPKKEHKQQPKKRLKLRDEPPSFDKDQRRKDAIALTKYINLARIPPSHLATTVKSSGLVDKEDLLQTHEKQALCFSSLMPKGPFRFDVEDDLNALKRSKFVGAMTITVQGAGVEGANGTYVLGNVYYGSPEYFMEDEWNGEDRVFMLSYSDGWEIGLADTLGNCEMDEVLFFHDDHEKKMPTAGWKAVKNRYGSAPTLTYKENEI